MSTTPCVLVFVTDQSDGLRLIRVGKQLAEQEGAQLQVVSIQPTGGLTEFATQQLQTLDTIAQKMGGTMNILFSQEVILTAAVAARQLHAGHIVSGSPGDNSNLFIEGVRQLIPELPWTVVEPTDTLLTFPPIESKSLSTHPSPHSC